MFSAYKDMQNLNRKTIECISCVIRPGIALASIKNECEQFLLNNGADSFWYWNVGALIFAGNETVNSISGKDYQVSNGKIHVNDIITIDLSPQRDYIGGDFARTIIIENGKVVKKIHDIQNNFWRRGLETEETLHAKLIEIATPDMTFEDLYYEMNRHIQMIGFCNLDFMNNLGHSIEKQKGQRIYIEQGNTRLISSVNMFTFEPHISDGKYGYKKENIYYFDRNKLVEL